MVGGGITSAATCSLLGGIGGVVDLTVWDKARGAGGRMSTRRSPGQIEGCTVDLGAQYITRHKQFIKENE